MGDVVNIKRASLMREIANAQAALDQLEVVPNLDEYPDGTVIRVRVRDYSRPALTYVFFKLVIPTVDRSAPYEVKQTRWYFTGSLSGRSSGDRDRWVTADGFASWLTERGRVIESWELMLPANDDATEVVGGAFTPLNGGELDVFVVEGHGGLLRDGRKLVITWNDDTQRWEL